MTKYNHKQQDLVILVDEQDQVIGQADKIRAHRGEGMLHRACSVFLFDKQGRLLIQKRSDKKIVAAGKWANTACGNLRPGETYQGCAQRRLKEELGITGVNLKGLEKFQYFVKFDNGFSEKEIDTVFAGFISQKQSLNPNQQEVADTAWIQLNQIDFKKNWAPWLKKIFQQPNIKQQLFKLENIQP